MRCPYCEPVAKCLIVRQIEEADGLVIHRTYRCFKCQGSFKTIERVEPEPNKEASSEVI